MSKYDKSYYNWNNHCIPISEAEIIHQKQFSWWRKLLGIKPKVYWIHIRSENGMLFKEFGVLNRMDAEFSKYSYTYSNRQLPIESVIGPFATFNKAWYFTVNVEEDTNADNNRLWLQG